MAQNGFGFKGEKYYLQNNFYSGEVGDKLAVNKDSELYATSANIIINMIPNEIGTLKVNREQIKHISDSGMGQVEQVILSQYGFYIVLTNSAIFLLDKDTYNLFPATSANKIATSFSRKTGRAVLMENYLVVPQADGVTRKVYEINAKAGIGDASSNFNLALRNPVKDRSKVKIDIYQVRNIKVSGTTSLRPYKVNTTELQEFSISGTALKFKYDTGLNIARIYYPYQADMINIEDLPNLKENDYYVCIYPVETVEKGQFYIGNQGITFSGQVNDTKGGSYYTTVTVGSGSIGKTGLMSYGAIFNNFNTDTGFNVCTEHQNRMVVSDGEYIYFSKSNEYMYFLNGTGQADAFFVRVSTINNERTKVQRLISGRGLWCITDKGIFLIGYNQQIQGSNLEIRLIGVEQCSYEAFDMNNTLFFLTNKGELKSVQNTTGNRGYIDFTIYTVDKFNNKQFFNQIDEYTIDNKKYVLACLKEPKVIGEFNVSAHIFYEQNLNVFGRVSLEMPTGVVPHLETLFKNTNEIYTMGDNNVPKAYIKLNIPPTYSEKYGNLLNDTRTPYRKITFKMLDENLNGIKRALANGRKINRLGGATQGIFLVYTADLMDMLSVPIEILLETNNNKTELELQATEIAYAEPTLMAQGGY